MLALTFFRENIVCYRNGYRRRQNAGIGHFGQGPEGFLLETYPKRAGGGHRYLAGANALWARDALLP